VLGRIPGQLLAQPSHREQLDALLVIPEQHFRDPASGHEKGSVENLIGLAQRYIVGPDGCV